MLSVSSTQVSSGLLSPVVTVAGYRMDFLRQWPFMGQSEGFLQLHNL